MVIRGRRVNRCDTCTRRKVKCDEGRPGCERCKKSGLICGGYSFNLVIVGSKDGLSSAPGELVIWRPQLDGNDQNETQPPRRQRPIRPKPQCQSPVQPQIRSLQPKEDAVLTGHLLSRFRPPNDAEASAPAALLPQLIRMDKSLSAQALSAIYFGKMRNQYQVYQKGTRLYVQALDQLRKAIDDPVRARQNDTLTSVLCLCLYEHVVLSETTAWLKHYQGVGRLVEYRGPECHQTEFERDIFRICRFMIILAAGVTKSHCFLAEERWKSSRTQPIYQYQAAVDRLYDIMAGVPGLFHDMDYLTHLDKSSESPLYIVLRDQAQRILSELYEWPQYLSQCAQLDTSHRFSAHDGASELDMPLPPKNPAIAAALAIFYATILSLATATDYFDLPLHLPSITHSPTRTEQSPEQCDPARKAHVRKTLACEICHLATAKLRGEQSTSTAFFFIFSLQVAHQHLPPNTPEGMRLEGLLDSVIAEKHGFETGRTREWATLFNSPPAIA